MNRNIPCEDCADRTLDTEQIGFHVTGCAPDPARPGRCILTFEEVAASAAAATAPAPAQAAPAAGVTAAITPTQAAAAKAIVNIFETGEVLGDYGNVTLIAGDTGHLTFGRSQTTLGSGNLALLLQKYCANLGARFGARLKPSLPRFVAIDHSLDNDLKLQNVLRATADDPVMRETQDIFFDQTYWQPALRAAGKLGLNSPLATTVVYDGFVHGAWAAMRDRTTQSAGAPDAIGERAWITAYVATRRDWLENNVRADLRPTVYRMDAFKRLIDQGFWALGLPLLVRSQEISAATLAAMPPGCYDGPHPGSRPIALQAPLARGLDVRLVQLGLSDRGVDIHADGVFGQTSANLVKTWQAQNGHPANGVLDAAMIGELTT
ncbi:peptidoglycan-binding protein [Variovorax sp. dw_308]|uniref:chitosanase n=1 Tax=Variovorax sp. dw_308 TaxID=2721546 RepID=UPI001C47B4AE|nr:peptidoglycan-binding protein [Variovorax sp. dw_308]